MAVTFESIQIAGGGAGDTTVTKPTGLAVGDLMIAFIASLTGGAGGETHSGPSGWTKIENQVPTNGAVITVWAVVATSTQTAASDFSWTSAGTNSDTSGSILRFTSTNGFNSVASNIVSNSNTALTTTGVTTLSTSTILVLCGADEDGTSTATFSSYSVANNDPTWTERADFPNDTSGSRINVGIATAPYALQQATGSSSITSSLGTSDVSSALIAITENINVTVTTTTLALTLPNFNVPTMSAGVSFAPTTLELVSTLNAPTALGTAQTQWTNPDKPSTIWTNTDKL